TPWPAATKRNPVITNSRMKMTTTTQNGTTASPTRIANTVITSALSASGSRNFPSSLTRWRLRAMRPSRVSVAAAAEYTTTLTWSWNAHVAVSLICDPLAQLHHLAHVALRRRLRLLRIEHLDVDAPPVHFGLEHVEDRAELTLGCGEDGERGRLERDLDRDVLEVVASRDLASRLVDRVDQLLTVEVADDVERELLRH